MKAKKSLGQNFLIDDNIINKIVSVVDAKEDDLIIEIGPGRGALTKYLVNKKCRVLCYEIDRDMDEYLNKLNVEVLYKDFLQSNILEDISSIKYNNLYIVGNLPYYITTPIIEHIIDSKVRVSSLVIMVQKEVGERFMAKVHSREYGYMSVLLQMYFDIHKVMDVSRVSFRPVPGVDSVVLKLVPKEVDVNIDIDGYKEFLSKVFRYKRKTLRNNLGSDEFEKAKVILDKYNLGLNVRAEEIDKDILLEIYHNI